MSYCITKAFEKKEIEKKTQTHSYSACYVSAEILFLYNTVFLRFNRRDM